MAGKGAALQPDRERAALQPDRERRSDPQATTYVTPEDRDRFEAYAGKFGLDANNLLHLVWRHELRVVRLEQLAPAFQESSRAARAGGLTSKVTAHLPSVHLKQQIVERARQAGLPVSRAGAALLHEELRECWLTQALDFGDSN